MSKSRLPPPPARGGARPLPPEPPAGDKNDAPPPLPSRPSHGGKPPPSTRLPPPPAVVNGQDGPVDDYLEPDDWSSNKPPVIPPKNFESSDEDDDDDAQTYEEPDLTMPQSRHQPPPPPPEPQQETYDDLDDVRPEPIDEPGETYDEFDVKSASQQQPSYEEDQLYEAEPPSGDMPPPSPQFGEGDGDVYEFMPDNEEPPPVPTPPPVSHTRPHIPLPPEPGLPSRPPPSRPPDKAPSADAVPDLPPGRPVPSQGPGKLSNIKKMSGDGPQMLGISQEAIGLKRANLKKVVSDDSWEPDGVREPDGVQSEPRTSSDEQNTVKARINMFKQAEKGGKPALATKPNLLAKPQSASVGLKLEQAVRPKPLLPVKPTLSTAVIASRNLGPPPVPPSRILGPPPPPPPSAIYKKPSEVKSPPPQMKTLPQPQPSPVKPPPPPPAPEFTECDDIYDEGFSYVPDPLSKEEWYHGEIERGEANSRLQSIGQDGTFLVRKSKQGGDQQPYTLAVLYKGHVYNLKMRSRRDGKVALGEEKSDELAFKDVTALVSHHRSHDVILVNVKEKKQYKTLLNKHPININAN